MDQAVEEVFERMLERSCRPVGQPSARAADSCARISFSGSIEAQCVVEFTAASAQLLTGAFLGSGPGEWDATMIADAVGELCNMIAGGWKKRLGAPGWEATISVPCISLTPVNCAPESCRNCMRRAYTFDNSPFVVTLITQKAAGSIDPTACENPSSRST
jgi:chemotaxis protein CheX